jgi:hypothetical protein
MNAVVNRVKGSERILSVTNSGFVQLVPLSYLGLVLHNADMRINSYFRLYEQFFVHNLKFKFTTTLPKTAAGTIHMAPDYDPMDIAPLAADAVSNMASFYHYKSAPVCENLVVDMPNFKLPSGEWNKPCLFAAPAGAERMTSYGSMLVYVDGCASGSADVVGHLTMDYDISFCIPQVDTALAITDVGSSMVLTAYSAMSGVTTLKDVSLAKTTVQAGPIDTSLSLLEGEIYTALLGNRPSTNNLDLMDRGGNFLEKGTRVFFKAPTIFEVDDGTEVTASNFKMGPMSLSRFFNPAHDVIFGSANVGDVANLNFIKKLVF